MRGVSRQVLARAAAAALVEGDCAGRGIWWARMEATHRAAPDPATAEAVLEEVRRQACSGCPARMACAIWAQTEKYDGIAAGSAYERGVRKPLGWVPRRKPGRRSRRVAS
jgi:hypothetical protein